LAWLYNESPVKDTVVVNDRWGYADTCKHGGFYTCQDHYNPGYLVKHKWENAFTIDKLSWGFRRTANLNDYMTIQELLYQVVTTTSTGGNVLINVAPTSYGKIAPIYEERLRQMGSWLKVNGEAIYASVPWKYQNDTTNSNVWYTSSNDGKSVYAILLVWPSTTSEVTLGAVVSSSSTVVNLLGSSTGSLPWHAVSETGGIVIDLSNIKSYSLQSDWTWVFKLENISPKQSASKKSKKYRS
jgi:alpha-L-fucosidase